MKKNDIDKIIREINKLIKHNIKERNYNISYILEDEKDINKSFAIITNGYHILKINLNTFKIKEFNEVYDYDKHIFGQLQRNKRIIYMCDEVHCGLINEYVLEEPFYIKNKKGLKKYIEYCNKNKIIERITETYSLLEVE